METTKSGDDVASVTTSDVVKEKYFTKIFWGEKHLGFDVLYHNMKHGQVSAKALQEFIRENANFEELYAKNLTKLAKLVTSSTTLGTFSPMFDIVKIMAEKVSSCHMDVVHKLHEIIKSLARYIDKQKGKHKQVKNELSGTASAVHHVQNTTIAVQRSKEKYHQLSVEAKRLKRAGAPPKDIEKMEAKCKKASEDYSNLVERYNNLRSDYEKKMFTSAERFQDIEVSHLKHMKSVLDSYMLAHMNANRTLSQVHQEMRNQVIENTIESLIERFSENNGTGTEKPPPIPFEECDANAILMSTDANHTSSVANHGVAPHAHMVNKPAKLISLSFRRKKPRNKQPSQESVSPENKVQGKKKDSHLSEEDNNVKVDEEGFTVRTETSTESKSSWTFDSSGDSDSDHEDVAQQKIHVKINPKDKENDNPGANNLDTLNAITRNLILNTPIPLAGKKLSRQRSERDTSASSVVARRRICSHSDTEAFRNWPLSSAMTSNTPFHNFPIAVPPSSECSQKPTLLKRRLDTTFKTPSCITEESPQSEQKNATASVQLRHIFQDPNKILNGPEKLVPDKRFSTSFVNYQVEEEDIGNDKQLETFQSPPSSLKSKSVGSLVPESLVSDQKAKLQNFTSWQQFSARPEVPSRLFEKQTFQNRGHCLADTSPSRSIVRNKTSAPVITSPVTPILKAPGRKKPVDDNAMQINNTDSEKSEKSTSNEILNHFDKSAALSIPKSRTSSTSLDTNDLTDFFANKPTPAEADWTQSNKSTTDTFEGANGSPMGVSSRGPSMLVLAHGDPIPFAVAFTETVNAYFKGPHSNRCLVKLTGDLQFSLPAGIVRAFTSGPNPTVLRFRLKGTSKLQDIVPNKSLLRTESSDASECLYSFDMTSLLSRLKKMEEENPDSPHYIIHVLSYQLSSASGHSMVPLHLTSQWKREVDATDVTIEYKYNSATTSSPLKKVQVIVPVDGKVTNVTSTPAATWLAGQDRLVWKLDTISSDAPIGTLKSKLTLASGPSKSASLAVLFLSEGSTLSGVDFELTGLGYTLSLVMKRYATGKYLLDAS